MAEAYGCYHLYIDLLRSSVFVFKEECNYYMPLNHVYAGHQRKHLTLQKNEDTKSENRNYLSQLTS